MNFQEAEKTYRELKAQHDSGKLSDSTFEAEVNKLRMQDTQGRWWQVGVQTGEWYMHDGQMWNKAKPPTETPIRSPIAPSHPVSNQSNASRMTFEEAEFKFGQIKARVQGGESITRIEYEKEVGELAVQDHNGTLWEINPRTGKWMYFDGVEWRDGIPPGHTNSTVLPSDSLTNSGTSQQSKTSIRAPQVGPTSPGLVDLRNSSRSITSLPSKPTRLKFFLTHSWKDVKFASKLADDLRATELDGFFDKYSIKPGDNIPMRIDKGLKECDVYIPVLSRAALASPWCEEEISIAIMLGKEPERNGKPRIIPVLIENCVSEMYSFLKVRLYIDFSNRYNDALKELLVFMQEVASQAR